MLANCGKCRQKHFRIYIKSTRTRKAACDVLAHEPPAPGLPLLRLPNFLATPHLGAATDEALLRVGMCVVEQIFTVLDGKTPAHECIGTTDRTDVESEHK